MAVKHHITKTLYLEYQACGKNTWLKLHKPDVRSMFVLSEFEQGLLAKGNLVEEWARKLFSGGVMVDKTGEEGAVITKDLMVQKAPVIFQATFIKDEFLARNDVLEYDSENDQWNLYEVKGTNSLNDKEDGRDHIDDAAFQAVILRDIGVRVGHITIIHLNKEYVRGEDIVVSQLFAQDDVTERVASRLDDTREKMLKAAEALTQLDEQALTCQCLYVGRSAQCTTFCYSHPEVPEYSVHDLSRIGLSKKKLEALVDQGIFDISEIPDEFPLSDIQKNQMIAHKTQKPIVDADAIRKELSSLAFPLFFLDYESYPSAIPLFKGYKPYQQIPFQFSLDRLTEQDGKLEHFEYLHEDASDPSPEIIKRLREVIEFEGTIIVWHKPFERMINSQLAERNPDHEQYLNEINNRIYDLKDIFHKQLHVHPGFRGKTSIKNVLPVMVPSLTYKELEIQNGGAATEAWYQMVFGDGSPEERKKIANDLKKYCGRDTEAMVVIWQALQKLVR